MRRIGWQHVELQTDKSALFSGLDLWWDEMPVGWLYDYNVVGSAAVWLFRCLWWFWLSDILQDRKGRRVGDVAIWMWVAHARGDFIVDLRHWIKSTQLKSNTQIELKIQQEKWWIYGHYNKFKHSEKETYSFRHFFLQTCLSLNEILHILLRKSKNHIAINMWKKEKIGGGEQVV